VKFLRVGQPDEERPYLLDRDGRYFDLATMTGDLDGEFFAGGGIDAVRRALGAGSLPEVAPPAGRIGAPIARPSAVMCIGMNYAEHAAESGSAPPEHPVLFYKAPNTIVGPYDPIVIPRGSTKTDWEVELGVVIGARASYLPSPEASFDVIAGYVLSNDVSERAFQLEVSGGQWSKGKSCASFNPLGPWLVTPDEVGDPMDLRMRSQVNDEPRQDSSTADMIFSVPFLVWHLSQFLVLEPGDLINTGTPQGVALSGRFPYLRADDVVEISIEKLGEQRSVCIDAPLG
jgi:2-keto-4-pentenoate hydratase/2-oxohepta-3-ene-1,7-dioic acid hydratase in catechol pathway